jgi:serine/threonine protein kinase
LGKGLLGRSTWLPTSSPMAQRFVNLSKALYEDWSANTPIQVVLKSAEKNDTNLAREIHHHRQFLHPHIARLYEVIVTEHLVWLVLEYCPGTKHPSPRDFTALEVRANL